MGVMDVQPYSSSTDTHYPQHQFPNSLSYSYGYGADDDDRGPAAAAEFADHNPSGSSKNKVKGSSLSTSAWNPLKWDEPEAKRKRRVASYKYVSVEAKMHQSVKNSMRWIKAKCFELRYRWW